MFTQRFQKNLNGYLSSVFLLQKYTYNHYEYLGYNQKLQERNDAPAKLL